MKTKYRIIQCEAKKYCVQYAFKTFFFYSKWYETTYYDTFHDAKEMFDYFIRSELDKKERAIFRKKNSKTLKVLEVREV